MLSSKTKVYQFSVLRIQIWYALLLIACALFIVRLFYLQVLRHDYYSKAALSSQLKEYEIPAERGVIEAHDGDKIIPIVLNEKRYTLFADPKFIKDADGIADKVATIIGGDKYEYARKMVTPTRYVILAKKLDKDQREKIDKLAVKGLGTRETDYRTYPQGELAAQLLGFVNDEGQGKYGVEEYLDNELKGAPGQLKAITDAAGVPLVANEENIVIDPQPGKRLTLTIDISLQRQAEDLLKAGLDKAKSKSGSVLILDANSGAVRAMANYPTYNPGEFFKVEDASVFNNAVVSAPLEVGSTMKPFTVGAAIDRGAVSPSTSYYDPGFVTVDGATISNVAEVAGAGHRTIQDVLTSSLNTGAVYVLKQIGGGEINLEGRQRWHDYMTNHYRLGKATGIEQGYEADGFIPDPKEGYGLGIQYANTAFGQGMSATILQMGSAFSALVNGGDYYKPHLIEAVTDNSGKTTKTAPQVLQANVVSGETSRTMRDMLQEVARRNLRGVTRPGYVLGSKSGTAQIAAPGGGYYPDKYNGTYIGFVGGDKPQYVIVVRVNEPGIAGHAGSRAAGPVFVLMANMLMDNFGVTLRN